jgi:hypothetical protein
MYLLLKYNMSCDLGLGKLSSQLFSVIQISALLPWPVSYITHVGGVWNLLLKSVLPLETLCPN